MRDAERERRQEKRLVSAGEFLESLQAGRGLEGLDNGWLRELKWRAPREGEPEGLLIVKASDGRGEWIGFVGALELVQALLMWRARDGGKGLKWRVDKPYGT